MNYVYTMNSSVIKIEVKESDRTVYRDAIATGDEKAFLRLLRNLDRKGYISIKKLIKLEQDTSWF